MFRRSQWHFPVQKYWTGECAIVWKTRDEFGGLSNMAGGWPLLVDGVRVASSEALYQACRFPDCPDAQIRILAQSSPMSAKMVSKPYRGEEDRADWDEVRVEVMEWCLGMKLAQHWDRFSALLCSTNGRSIVERSRRDDFWGAKPQPDTPGLLVGRNVLGCLLEELRAKVRETPDVVRDMPPPPPSLGGLHLPTPPKPVNIRVPNFAPLSSSVGQHSALI